MAVAHIYADASVDQPPGCWGFACSAVVDLIPDDTTVVAASPQQTLIRGGITDMQTTWIRGPYTPGFAEYFGLVAALQFALKLLVPVSGSEDDAGKWYAHLDNVHTVVLYNDNDNVIGYANRQLQPGRDVPWMNEINHVFHAYKGQVLSWARQHMLFRNVEVRPISRGHQAFQRAHIAAKQTMQAERDRYGPGCSFFGWYCNNLHLSRSFYWSSHLTPRLVLLCRAASMKFIDHLQARDHAGRRPYTVWDILVVEEDAEAYPVHHRHRAFLATF